MSSRETIGADLDKHIAETHDRFTAAMARRLPAMDLAQKEQYFAVLSALVAGLEERQKPLKQVLQEVAPQVLPLVMQQLSS